MAETFASTADIYRLTGDLPEGADQQYSADLKGKSIAESSGRSERDSRIAAASCRGRSCASANHAASARHSSALPSPRSRPAFATHAPWRGRRTRLMAETFASTADIYRLTGDLPEGAGEGLGHQPRAPAAPGGVGGKCEERRAHHAGIDRPTGMPPRP
jgi:hypothetical protein